MTMTDPRGSTPVLKRELGVFGATMMGLGAMLGTGVFVSIGLAAGVAGAAVIPAIGVAGLLALCNALSSAQLAAAYPVSGGTYEYGRRLLNPMAGFLAGWMFLLAKSASAASAALGVAGYLGSATGLREVPAGVSGAVVAAVLCALVLGGIRKSGRVNAAIVFATLLSLGVFVLLSLPLAKREHLTPWLPLDGADLTGFPEACALMFVAFTGYARIATLGEEVRDPQRTIPRAILTAIGVSTAILLAVAVGAVGWAGPQALAAAAAAGSAPLGRVMSEAGYPAAAGVVSIGAVTAMLGVLLNLVLGLSRVMLAMGRTGDLPGGLARVNGRTGSPVAAVLVTGAVIAGLCLAGDIRVAWSFSAFTVLVYYAITNLAALRLPPGSHRYPRVIAWVGLAACALLAFQIDRNVLAAGFGVLAAGVCWRLAAARLSAGRGPADRPR